MPPRKHQNDPVANLLGTLQEVNPPLEKLMAERVQLRHQMRAQAEAHAAAAKEAAELRVLRETEIPRYLALAKSVAIISAVCALIALAISLFTHLIGLKATIPLFAFSVVQLWVVDRAETRFGRWRLHISSRPDFAWPRR